MEYSNTARHKTKAGHQPIDKVVFVEEILSVGKRRHGAGPPVYLMLLGPRELWACLRKYPAR